MDIRNDARLANYCLTVLANGAKLPTYAYYVPSDNVKSLFWNGLSFKELKQLHRHFTKQI